MNPFLAIPQNEGKKNAADSACGNPQSRIKPHATSVSFIPRFVLR